MMVAYPLDKLLPGLKCIMQLSKYEAKGMKNVTTRGGKRLNLTNHRNCKCLQGAVDVHKLADKL